MASAGFEPANLGTKGQHANPKPPKPLSFMYMIKNIIKMIKILKIDYTIYHYFK